MILELVTKTREPANLDLCYIDSYYDRGWKVWVAFLIDSISGSQVSHCLYINRKERDNLQKGDFELYDC